MGSPMPKFLCVKGILFFSFWQATGVSLLASVGVIKRLGPYTDKEHISLGLTDTLICLEMPFFAIAHFTAFSQRDYVDKKLAYVGRMPMRHAFQDSFGFKDVLEDARATLNGQGMDYREFEPSEGHMHQGLGRERRIRAGLRYSHGGRGKYWLPQSTASSRWERSPEGGPSAPLLSEGAEDTIQDHSSADESFVAVGFDLPFGGYDSEDEELFSSSRKYLFGDYNYPCIDVSSEVARAKMWEEEERILNNERSAWFFDHHRHQGRGAMAVTGYGAVGVSKPQQNKSRTLATPLSPSATIDPEPTLGPVGGHSDAQLRWANVFWPKIRLKSPPNTGNSRVTSPPISREISAVGPMTRPDAVDLVTEDHCAADIAVSQEHHQGKLVSGDLTTQTHPFRHPGLDKVANVRMGDKSNDPHAAQGDAEGVDTIFDSEAIKPVIRVDSPQSHSRTGGLVNVVDGLEGDENPWA